MRFIFYVYFVLWFFCNHQAIAESTVEADKKFISIASQNLHRLFDDKDDPLLREKVLSPKDYQANLKKIADRIRDSFNCPDVLLLQEVENKRVLQDLAKKTCIGVKSYKVIFAEGFDSSGIDVGALVAENIHLLSWEQLATDQRLGKTSLPLYTRPPLMLRFSPDATSKIHITAVVVHLRSMVGLYGKHHQRIANKRKAQAEWLGNWVNKRLQANREEYLLVAGDFNAEDNAQGADAMLATIRNVQHNDDTMQLTNLNNLVPEVLRYTYIYKGKKQALDHMLVSQNTLPLVGSYKIIDSLFNWPLSAKFFKQSEHRKYSLDHNGLLLELEVPSHTVEK